MLPDNNSRISGENMENQDPKADVVGSVSSEETGDGNRITRKLCSDPDIDKAKWPVGPWSSEPDRIEWRAHGFACLMVRHPSLGHWCGYVGVEPGHPWHGKDYDSAEPYPDIHGGLTYAKECHGRVCHVPAPGEPEHLWWLGFDCAHSGDLSPGSLQFYRDHGFSMAGDSYRAADWVEYETTRLAEQAHDAEAPTHD